MAGRALMGLPGFFHTPTSCQPSITRLQLQCRILEVHVNGPEALMESLYTKYRPQTFADVVGQTHVVTTLERAVMEGRTSHAYLFCGPRGTGKTTMARLLAKALMCEQGAGHLPDGTCEQCRLIASGEHPDVYELDAASRTGVDNVREEIISRVSFAPVRAPYKMYIIDEVHMLTTAAFNALLKTLEEPPAHVVFVLCTTDPQKIPETILSRVQRFDFHAISNSDIQQRLAYICEREGFGYDLEALDLVVRHARGGMRDAISELEQLSVSGGGQISVDVARDVLGEVSASTLEHMSLAMANRDVPTLFAQVESLVEVGRDLLQFTRALAGRLRDVYVVAAIGAASGSVQAADDELPAISREAKAFGSVDRVARALELLSDASTEMRIAPNQRLVLEVALTKIARPQTELTLEALADRVATLERQVVALSEQAARKPAPAPAAAPAPAERQVNSATVAASAPESAWHEREEEPAPRPQRPVQKTVEAAPAPAAAPERRATPQSMPRQRQAEQAPAPRPVSRQAAPAPQPQPAAAAQPVQAARPAPVDRPATATTASDQGELQRRWKQVVDTLLSSHPQHGSLLMASTAVLDDGYNLLVSLPNGSGFACRMLERADVRANLDPLVNSIFGTRKVRFAEESVAASISASMAKESGQTAAAQAMPQRQPDAPRQSEPQPQRRSAAQQPSPRQAAPRVQAASQQRQTQPQRAPQPQPASPTHAVPQWQAPAPQAAPQIRPQPAPQPQPRQVQQAAPRQAPAPQQTYAAPWEPLDDDVVPYDDMDMSPYEEDYAFDPYAQVAAPAPKPQPVVWQSPAYAPRPQAAPQPKPELRPAPQPRPVPQSYAEPVTQAAPVVETRPVPQPVAQPAPQPQPVAQPAPEPQPVAQPAPQPQPAPVPEPAPTEAPAPKKAPAKRTSRSTGGVPNDILNMMTAIFGEGITYTSEPSEDEQVEAIDDEVATGDDFLDAASDDSEFLEEAVDDADYDED